MRIRGMQLPISIDTRQGVSLQSQVVDQLRALIREGQLLPGAAIPATRDLAKQLGISRNTVTAAYETLINEGYLLTEKTVGTFVAGTLPDNAIHHRGAASEKEPRTGNLYRAMNLPLPYGGRGPSGLHKPTPRQIEIDFVMGRTGVCIACRRKRSAATTPSWPATGSCRLPRSNVLPRHSSG
jgi:GntR family transcriptional regulator/MocR family aminotransferase